MDISIMLNCADIDKLIRRLQRCSLGRKKLQAQEFVDFTAAAKEGFTQLRFWLPVQKAGCKVIISNIT